MLGGAIAFFILALIAAAFGFGGIAEGAEDMGKILLVVFLILAVISLFFGRKRVP